MNMQGPNYDLKFMVSDVARIMKVDNAMVKKWAAQFSSYLSNGSRSVDGAPRLFSVVDLCVLAYVSAYWDEDPDIDSIESGLNVGEHRGFPFYEVALAETPIFKDPPIDMEGLSADSGVLLMDTDLLALAKSYKIAGDLLVDASISSGEAFEVVFPIVYCYRHATELFLKAVIPISGDEKRRIGHNPPPRVGVRPPPPTRLRTI